MRMLPSFKRKSGYQMAGDGLDSEGGGGGYTLPVASVNTLGGIKVGEGLSITPQGVLSATGSSGGAIVIADTEQEVGTFGNETLYSRRFDVTNLSGSDVQFQLPSLKNCIVKIASLVSTLAFGNIYMGTVKTIHSVESNSPYIDATFSTTVGSDMHFDLIVFYTKIS